ncbi:hypothetical protein Poli38472_000903 [Pythium oligandrum]|uniref:DDHD domain-containing protein n=1 Tax=Pythium oligandrum TaxID=41045 RepID=A0A8K1CCK4_PYTOL|nr:hypothetical protein Poli38472_000903 [Pythium oligandrum]|eukprot:TMW60861.1 hypothetical protein Poli38472_000903 [Pythium oligandrum]
MTAAAVDEENVPMAQSVEELPNELVFASDAVARYKARINDLIQRIEFLSDQVENLEVEGNNDPEHLTISRDVVWANYSALQACSASINETLELFSLGIQEYSGGEDSIAAALSVVVPDIDYDSDPHDINLVTESRPRIADGSLGEIVERVKVIFDGDQQAVEAFKTHVHQFTMGNESLAELYAYLRAEIPYPNIRSIIADLVRILRPRTQRIELLKARYTPQVNDDDLPILPIKTKSPTHGTKTQTTNDNQANDLPEMMTIPTINHLMFTIHGIGKHVDFQDGEFKSWDGESGLEGSNHYFRELYKTMLETVFQDVPVALELQSVEWHEELHEPTGVDNVFDLICPDGSSGIRDFNKQTFMDLLYYASPHFGQLVVDTVTNQLNQKYHTFMDEHPGWDGKVSIFAHSLGTVIIYDILTHKAGEVARNGVRFTGLDFEVENFFAAGSPVPVLLLSRGQLDIENGQFYGGLKMPACSRYFNFFHPIDPIAYRVEPLVRPDLHGVPPAQLIPAPSVRDAGFFKIQEMMDKIMAPVDGLEYRMDYELRRRKREGMMAVAYASASHSSYWMSEDVILFTIMQICKPVTDLVQTYSSIQRPLPILSRDLVELTPQSKVLISSDVQVRDRQTGFYHEYVAVMDHDRLHLVSQVQDLALRRKAYIRLTTDHIAMHGDDVTTLKLVTTRPSVSPKSKDRSPTKRSHSETVVCTWRASSVRERDEWVAYINEAIWGAADDSHLCDVSKLQPSTACHMVGVSGDHCLDYFSAIKTDQLQEKCSSTWWNNRWVVLQGDKISSFESAPRPFSPVEQLKLDHAHVFNYEGSLLLRVVSSSGTSIDMRVSDQATLNMWLDTFATVKASGVVIAHRDAVEIHPCAVLVEPERISCGFRSSEVRISEFRGSDVRGSDSSYCGEWLQTKVESYRLVLDHGGVHYANFAIQAITPVEGTKIVYRRYSEFGRLHQRLRKILPSDEIPSFPSTRMWNKLDAAYLKDKTVRLNGYLRKMCKLSANTPAQDLLLEFLEVSPPHWLVERESDVFDLE